MNVFFAFHLPGTQNQKADGMKRWEWQKCMKRMENCG